MDAVIEFIFKQVPLNVLNVILNVAILALMWKWIHPELTRLANEVSKTNGTVAKSLIWQAGHEKLDDERHEENIESLKDINQALRDLTIRRKP